MGDNIMVNYYTRKELEEKAAKTLVMLNNQRDAREQILSLLSNFLTYLKGLDAGFKPSELPFYSMFLISSTGCGKSELIKQIAGISGLQTAIVDASSMTAAGFKGVNVANAVKAAIDSVPNPNAFVEEGGVIIFDECDKLACTNPSYYESNPQANLLKLLERDHILQVDTKDSIPVSIKTERILFVFTGAFSRLEPVLKRKHQKNKEMGFLASSSNTTPKIDYMKYATLDDLCEFGMLRELIGRIGSLTYIPPLDEADYIKLIKGTGNSMQKIYKNMFKIHGVKFSITDDACTIIGQEAQTLGTGARALQPLLRKYLAAAFNEIDVNPNITTVCMTSVNNKIILNYDTAGIRTHSYIANTNAPATDQDLSHYLKSETGIFFICNKLVEMSQLRSIDEKTAFFYLLQTICRYLSLETNKSDQCYSSLIRLTRCILKSNTIEESVFDILMKDAMEKEDILNSRNTLKMFWELYNSISGLSMANELLKQLTVLQNRLAIED